MRILLYNPDNGVTGNFMPHLWMFLLQALTPPGHEVLLIDGNAQPLTDAELVEFVKHENIGLVGIGAMTRMIARAYRAADALRAAGVPVVMGGPHVTELPDEALAHADSVALGEADETWPRIIEDAVHKRLKRVYAPVNAFGQEHKPDLGGYPKIPWESLDLAQFNRIPAMLRPVMRRFSASWEQFHLIPIESGRGCPYGCEFCTVTGFFGDSIRFRSNASVVNELLRLKARRETESRKSRGLLRGRQFRDQCEAHQIPAAGHHRGGRTACMGGADQRQFAAGRRIGRPDRGIRRQVDLHWHGVPGRSESEERQQEF